PGWPAERPLSTFFVTPPPSFEPYLQLVAVPVGAWSTFSAVWVFAGNLAQELGPRCGVWLVIIVVLAATVWFALAHVRGWRRPSLPFILLLALQLFGAAYYFSSFRAPARRLETRRPGTTVATATVFDFHAHTTRSNGLLTPQQQIDWHRARGFSGLAFTDSNTMVPEAEMNVLRAANPDMLLLNGCEYHGDAHLILLGLKTPLSASSLDVPAAIQAAQEQDAIVIVAHPWSPARFTAQQLLEMGADGLEAWNGVIWSRPLADLVQERNLIATTATDTLSKSGARCFTWTILPPGLNDPNDVLRALRRREFAVAYALSGADTPEAYEVRQARLKRPPGLFLATGAAWGALSRAQRINALLGLAALIALLWAWGAQSGQASTVPLGPHRALGFLRRKRLAARVVGLALMLFAFAGSIGAALLTMGAVFKSGAAQQQEAAVSPLYAVAAWVVLDMLYFYGRSFWRRTQ
ncbi:MAG TPA: hypothetical protein VNA16_00615, partial [Abditibacteriaceae bacterium]|nr:hypothetical protein [Abditibacteriaceae bacterium]